MSLSQTDIESIITLWKYSEQQADPRSKEKQITSGLREKPLLSCQYWIKGIGTVCSYWNGSKCSYPRTAKNFPSGYNHGYCDYLGRRNTCDKYDGTVDNENYQCIAPNIFLSGLGKVAGKTDTGYLYAPIPKEDIWGYCEGKCDGQGMGTGCDGIPGVSPVVCNYYRPWQMGFGSLEPRQIRKTFTEDGLINIENIDFEKALGEVFDPMELRLPFAFDVYNLRAQFQKCAHWNNDYGSYFNMDKVFGYISSDEDLESLCVCEDAKATPYHTLKNPVGAGVNKEWLLQDVWSEANTVICNGAKPECPCYTGEWNYCNDLNMYTGARITANLVFELRFWADYWENQEEYNEYFRKRPNFQDTPTPNIYTFTKWQRLGETAADSVAEGRVLSLDIGSAASDENKRFYPKTYITSTDLQYSSAGINIGTTVPEENQIYFPSLIRNIDEELGIDIEDGCLLQIVYPYLSDDPFLEDKTNELPSFICMKKGSCITGDIVSVIGFSIRNKSIYAFNLNNLDSTLAEFESHRDVSTLSQERVADEDGNMTGLSPREKFNLKIEEFILGNQKTNVDDITTGTTNENGYFNLGPLELNYGEINKIVVCIKYSTELGLWDFRIRNVVSVWYGGVIVQDFLTHESDGWSLPGKLLPPAIVGGKAICSPTKCYLSEIVNSYSYAYTNHLFENHLVTSYCYKKIERNTSCDQWKRIGNFGYVWVELEDTNINTIFKWGITDAFMTYKGEETDEEIVIPMEIVDLREEFISGSNGVPPSACVLKIKEGEAIPPGVSQIFWKDEWDLSINYWYKKISNSFDGEGEILWPDLESKYVHTRIGKLSITMGNSNDFIIAGVSTDTPAVFAVFRDEDGRIVNTMATKMLIQIAKIDCRSEEIFYKYSGPATKYKLSPDTGGTRFRTDGSVIKTNDEVIHYYTPVCGDHENGKEGIGKGPMWFPYDMCEPCDFYNAWGNAAYCTAWFQCAGEYGGSDTNLLRYCGPSIYEAYAHPRASLAFCHLDFLYSYSKMNSGNVIFSGYANIVHWVDIHEYKANKWTLPPFGNKGREFVFKYLSQDYITHVTYKGERPATTSKWMPLVPTSDDFLMPIGSFDEVSFLANNGFFHTNQLNFFKSSLINEIIDEERYRFEDVFGTRRMYVVSYPKPDPYSIQYYFKEDDVVWAWQEYWKEIEITDRNLYFVSYSRPDYKYDYLKVEHRYICTEGKKTINFKAPETSDSILTTYPSISLDGGPPRFFNIIYDNYTGEIEWVDENDGTVGGSSQNIGEDGEKKKNIYEETSPNAAGSKWNHGVNCLFDEDAVSTYDDAKAAGREFKIFDDQQEVVEYYYNRGIIVDIKREDLIFLPCDEFDFDLSSNLQSWTSSNVGGMGNHNYYGISPNFVYDIFNLKEEETFNEPEHLLCISEVKITGLWGLNKMSNTQEYGICIPGIKVIEIYDNTIINTLVDKESISYDEDSYGDEMGLNPYEFVFKLQVTPKRMLNKQFYNAVTLQINLSPFSDQYIYLNTIEFKVSKYMDSSEIIDVYERKYVPSRSDNLGDWNINGPKVPYSEAAPSNFILQHDLDLDNSGSYYAIHPQLNYVPSKEFETRDKIRAGYASKQYFEKEKLDVNIGNLNEVELKQKEFYDDAYNRNIDGDTIHFNLTKPVYFKSFPEIFLDFIGFLDITVKIPTWEENNISSQYEKGTLWFPGGHFWKWSSSIEAAACYEYVIVSPSWVLKKYNLQDVIYTHVDLKKEEAVSNILVALMANRLGFKLKTAEKAGLLEGMDIGNLTGTASQTFNDPMVDVIP